MPIRRAPGEESRACARARRALAVYDQGWGALREAGMYRETRRFVRAVLTLRARL
jgi:hypothetical protein